MSNYKFVPILAGRRRHIREFGPLKYHQDKHSQLSPCENKEKNILGYLSKTNDESLNLKAKKILTKQSCQLLCNAP